MDVTYTHCRPGLAMTFDEYTKAKTLILDLLGCGMSPENLVEAGISKHCLVPCLRELKLRLPTNVDLSDVVFYDPPSDSASSSAENESKSFSKRISSRMEDNEDGSGRLQGETLPFQSAHKRKRKGMADGRRRIETAEAQSIQASNPGMSLNITQPPEQEGNDSSRDAGENEPQMSSEADIQEFTPSHPLKGMKKNAKNAGRRKSFQAGDKKAVNTTALKGPGGASAPTPALGQSGS